MSTLTLCQSLQLLAFFCFWLHLQWQHAMKTTFEIWATKWRNWQAIYCNRHRSIWNSRSWTELSTCGGATSQMVHNLIQLNGFFFTYLTYQQQLLYNILTFFLSWSSIVFFFMFWEWTFFVCFIINSVASFMHHGETQFKEEQIITQTPI